MPARRVVPPCHCLYCWRRGRGLHSNDANLSGLLTTTASPCEEDNGGVTWCVFVVGNSTPDVQCCREPLGLPTETHWEFDFEFVQGAKIRTSRIQKSSQNA